MSQPRSSSWDVQGWVYSGVLVFSTLSCNFLSIYKEFPHCPGWLAAPSPHMVTHPVPSSCPGQVQSSGLPDVASWMGAVLGGTSLWDCGVCPMYHVDCHLSTFPGQALGESTPALKSVPHRKPCDDHII